MPEVQRSFYTTGKVGIDYFHYVADELPAICGKWFHLDQRRENTFIAGESMGGYGAVKIALNRPEKRQFSCGKFIRSTRLCRIYGDGTCRKLGRCRHKKYRVFMEKQENQKSGKIHCFW